MAKLITIESLQKAMEKVKKYIDDKFLGIPTKFPADGGNSDTVDYYHIWSGTQGQLDLLPSREPKTIYLVIQPLVFSITNNLTNCTVTNNSASINENESFMSSISANDGYAINSIVVTMNGIDITSTVVSNNLVNIPNVTGNIVITATATSILSISSITGGTFTTGEAATITYTTNIAVTKHEYVMTYSGSDSGFIDGTSKVTSSGNNHTMRFNAGLLSAGTKNGAIKVTDANGNTAIAQFTLVITQASVGLTITNVTAGTFTTNDTVRITYTTSNAIKKHEFNMHYGTSNFVDGSNRVTNSGNNYTMTFNPGDLSAGTKDGAIRVTDNNGNTAIGTFTLIITGDDGTLKITAITVLSSTVASTRIRYTTNRPVTKHYFTMGYINNNTGFTDGKPRVTDNGNNTYTMTFENALSAGTKTPAIKVQDAQGNTYVKTFDLTVTA